MTREDRRSRPILVGVDGTHQSLMAAEWAASDAARRGSPLRVVLVANGSVVVPADHQLARHIAQRCRAVAPQVEVSSLALAGHPVDRLSWLSHDAAQLVVGSHAGLGVVPIGSVGAALAVYASCPVIVVRGRSPMSSPPQSGPVVIGVIGCREEEGPLGFGFTAAAAYGAEVVIVRFPQADTGAAGNHAEWKLTCPSLTVRQVIPSGNPIQALAAAAAAARLLVVDGRGFVDQSLSPVNREVLRHATCPVAIVQPAWRPRDSS